MAVTLNQQELAQLDEAHAWQSNEQFARTAEALAAQATRRVNRLVWAAPEARWLPRLEPVPIRR